MFNSKYTADYSRETDVISTKSRVVTSVSLKAMQKVWFMIRVGVVCNCKFYIVEKTGDIDRFRVW